MTMFPKPKDIEDPTPAVREYRDGREACNLLVAAGRAEYKKRIIEMWERQGGLCCLCHLPLILRDATFEHEAGRGMGGGHRDDRIEVHGVPCNGAAHYYCNSRKGSVRIKYN